MSSKRILVEGGVQGVFFRQSAKNKADELGVTGWVRNLPDGRVEIEAHGDKEAVDGLIEWCKDGPIHADVDDITTEDADHEDHGEFKIKY
jgi:acylphosphatase